MDLAPGTARWDRRPKIVAALDAAGGLVAWTMDAEHVNVVSLDATGAPRAPATLVPMPGARDLFGVYRVGAGHVLLTHPLCAPQSLKCLDLLAFDEQGTAVGEPFSHRVGEWTVGHHVRVEGRALTLLRSQTYRPMVVERYALADGGAFTVETLATLGAPAGHHHTARRAPHGRVLRPGLARPGRPRRGDPGGAGRPRGRGARRGRRRRGVRSGRPAEWRAGDRAGAALSVSSRRSGSLIYLDATWLVVTSAMSFPARSVTVVRTMLTLLPRFT